MEEEQKDYEFINEIIVPKKKNKWLMRLERLFVVIVMAIIFGVVARWVFLSGTEEQQLVGLNKTNNQGKITDAPIPTISFDSIEEDENRSSLVHKYEEIRKVYANVSNCITIVEIVEQSIGLFEEIYEVKKWTTGLIVAETETEILILTDAGKLSEQSLITVCFGGKEVSGRVYSKASAYDLAVVAVEKKKYSKRMLEQIEFAKFTETELEKGIPVIALGGPNGYQNSIEQGMITSVGNTIPVMDGVLSYFTIDITNYDNGNGFIFNLDGEVLGMITHSYKKEMIQSEVCSVITLKDITCVIEGLLNTWKNVWLGITGRDFSIGARISEVDSWKYNFLEQLFTTYRIDSAVYVTKVENNSPAMKAGIKPGDIIYQIDSKEISGIQNLMETLPKFSVGYITQIYFISQTENSIGAEDGRITLGEKK